MREQRRERPGDRLTVSQAADQLGITVDAVRSRIKRGTIAHERAGGRVYVLLGGDQGTTGRGQPTDQVAPGREPNAELVEELRDQVQFLRRELERKDAILLRLAERVPELEAPSEPRESPESAEPRSDRGTDPVGPQEPAPRRSWWREFFGLG